MTRTLIMTMMILIESIQLTVTQISRKMKNDIDSNMIKVTMQIQYQLRH